MKATLAGMDWEVCEPTRGPAGRASATINVDGGRVTVSELAFEQAGKPEAFVLLYSAEQRSVGFQKADPREALAMLVTQKHAKSHGGHQFAAAMLARRMRSDGYSGTIYVPVQWHPDGLLWGDLTMATKRARKTAKAKGVAA